MKIFTISANEEILGYLEEFRHDLCRISHPNADSWALLTEAGVHCLLKQLGVTDFTGGGDQGKKGHTLPPRTSALAEKEPTYVGQVAGIYLYRGCPALLCDGKKDGSVSVFVGAMGRGRRPFARKE